MHVFLLLYDILLPSEQFVDPLYSLVFIDTGKKY